MDTETITLIIALASFIGVIVGPILTNLIMALESRADRQEKWRHERLNYLWEAMKSIIHERAVIQSFDDSPPKVDTYDKHYAYGKAQAIMFSTGDDQMRKLALEMNGLPSGRGETAKRDLVDAAIERLGLIINGLMAKR